MCFFFNETATTEIYTLSLHDALPDLKTFNEAGPIPANCEVAIGAPFLHIGLCLSELRDDIEVSAQNCGLNEKPGAYTGEICASQLVDAGCTWVIIGHSERREGFGMAGEDSELVAKKVKVALDAGLKVMFAIGKIGRAHSELQSHHDLVCRLLLEKKKHNTNTKKKKQTPT